MAFSLDLDILALVGLTIWGAFFVGQIFRRLGIPQVVGFIVAGTLLGQSFLNAIPPELSENLLFVSELALALIGFDMGEHLRFGELRKLGKSIILIVICEAMGAFLLVLVGVYALTRELHTALIFGAIASATAPAATVDVLAEYGADGPLTTTLLAVVGIDDAVSLLLFSISAALVEPMLAHGSASLSEVFTSGVSLIEILELPVMEIGGSLVVGALFGWFITRWITYIDIHHEPDRRQHDTMAVCVAAVFIAAGLSHMLELSLILTTMTMGVVVVNLRPRYGSYIRFTIEHAGPVVYVLFFALVGARFDVSALPEMGALGLLYIALRSGGKYVGVLAGGTFGSADPVVRNNLGLGLLSQAGVAIGLALDCDCRFAEFGPEGEELGSLILTVITATTFVVQLIGPIMVKLAITRAGEIGQAKEVAFVNDAAESPAA
jgi:Kef-type K+ transport system membrane component KefB